MDVESVAAVVELLGTLLLVVVATAVEVEVVVVVATRSQEGHMVRVVAGSCMKNGLEFFNALSS